jgi:hypothetical protein
MVTQLVMIPNFIISNFDIFGSEGLNDPYKCGARKKKHEVNLLPCAFCLHFYPTNGMKFALPFRT